MTSKEIKKAAALRYQQGQEDAPRVVAKGRGKVAEKIVQIAGQHQVPIVEDSNLVQMLEALDVDMEIPPDLYHAVAEILVFVYKLNKKL
ncbi:MAG: flagellar biosynthesis protein FlhB [Desulfobacteraceae bacterium]|nr:flagellar biosynthesis protein FlhB [Desulfobacteraceae bacterium]